MSFFAACARGLEYLLVDELQALGAARATAALAGVNVDGDLAVAADAVLWSRLASRVLWPLASFDCADEAALYAGVAAVDWDAQLGVEQTFAVDAHVSGAALRHAGFAAQRAKDAIVDRLRALHGERPSVDTDAPDVRLNLVVRKGRATLSVDLGGGSLHRRGWRRAQGEAPLKETLACAVLLRGGWPRVYADGGDLLDPMCGSGTLLIEGALMAADVAPGLLRLGDALPTHWRGFDAARWRETVAAARARADAGRTTLRQAFHGRDDDDEAIEAARTNATAAGVQDAIAFQRGDIDDVEPMANARGLAVCNPPYDARLAADPALYRRLGDALRRAAPQWRAALLCGDEPLARATGLRAAKTYALYNGALPVTLIVCDPIAPARAPHAPAPLGEHAQMVANRLRRNLRRLKSWRAREGVTCFRAYDADLPEYAAAVDVFEENGGAGRTFAHVQEYEAPPDVPAELARRRLNTLLAAVREVFALPREQVALKVRTRGKGGSKYGRMDARGEWLHVREGDARLRVNLFDYLDTGLFLDHRPTRLRIAREARGLRFLNLFAYTGAASVHAALGGARGTTSVDLSATYLQWAADNLADNGCGGDAHRLVQADALRWLEAERGEYDLIFCDPPTFSNSARANDFDVQRDHVRLVRAAVARLSPNGLLLFSNNARRFRLDAALADALDVRDVSAGSIPPDFARNPRIHRLWEIRRR